MTWNDTAEKKIRCLSLLQQEAVLAAAELKATQNDEDSKICNSNLDSEISWLSDFLTPIGLDDISQSNSAVAYFVAGYIGRSTARRRKCTACKEILVMSNDTPPLIDSVPDEDKSLFEIVNRGGLSTSFEFSFTVTVLSAQYYTAIAADELKLQKLLAKPNQHSVFVHATSVAVFAPASLRCLLDIKCSSNHENSKLLVQTAFNCFVKNILKRLNSRPMADEPPAKVLRKVRKLTSKLKLPASGSIFQMCIYFAFDRFLRAFMLIYFSLLCACLF